MKLTPLDIHHKEFRRSLRGYDEKEVDDFLDDVADDFERLFKENIELSEKLEAASEQLRRYQVNEQTIQNTMVAAQRSAEDIVGKANVDADQVLHDAETKAKEIIHTALQQKQKVAGELLRIKAAEEDFRARFKSMLASADREVSEIAVPEDVDALLSEGEEAVTEEAPPRGKFARSRPEPAAPATETEPAEAASEEPAPIPTAATPKDAAATSEAAPASEEPSLWTPESEGTSASETEPATDSSVQSLQFGEVESPEIEQEVDLGTPSEFRVPGLESFGERETDSDIEEID